MRPGFMSKIRWSSEQQRLAVGMRRPYQVFQKAIRDLLRYWIITNPFGLQKIGLQKMFRRRSATSLIDELRGGRNVFISPHHDDLAFSLGAMVKRSTGGLIINCFTRSDAAYTVIEVAPGETRIDRVSAVRKSEDETFANACALDRIDLGCLDPPIMGRQPRDLSGLDEDCHQVRVVLENVLDQALLKGSRDQPVQIFCPAAFGRHVQHRATFIVFLDWLASREDQLRAKEVKVFFYEDLPYSSRLLRRLNGIFRLSRETSRRFPSRKLKRIAMPLGHDSGKLELCAIYASQMKRPPSYREYSPFALWPPGPHEAVWRMTI